MTSKLEEDNPDADHNNDEVHRSPCVNNSATSSEHSDDEYYVSKVKDVIDTRSINQSRENLDQFDRNEQSLIETDRKSDIKKDSYKNSHRDRRTSLVATTSKDRRLLSSRDTQKLSHNQCSKSNKRTNSSSNKKLSYEEDEDDERSPSTSSPSKDNSPASNNNNIKTDKPSESSPKKKKWKSSESHQVVDENDLSNRNNGTQHDLISDKIKQNVEVKLATEAESDHDDASSTSSCSCEDHSSVVGETNSKTSSSIINPPTTETQQYSDEIVMDDLDYNEDSMSDDSANNIRENNRLKRERRTSMSTYNNKYDDQQNDIEPIQSSSVLSDNTSNFKGSKKRFQRITPSPTGNGESKGSLEKANAYDSRPRMKSFININHRYNQQQDLTGEEPSSEDAQNNQDLTRENILSSLMESKIEKSYDSLLKYFFKDACYFQVKSINHENVELSKSMGVWSTSAQNELRFNTAFREHRNVILIFSVQQSGAFQGFARIVSRSRQTSRPIPWILPERMSNKSLGGVFKIDWLCKNELPFHKTHDLYNPFNGNKPIKVARDGQQVVSKVGKKLCKLFPLTEDCRDDKKKLINAIATLKHQTSQRRKKSSHKQDNFYPLIDGRVAIPISTHDHPNGGLNHHENRSHRRLQAPSSSTYHQQPLHHHHHHHRVLPPMINGFGGHYSHHLPQHFVGPNHHQDYNYNYGHLTCLPHETQTTYYQPPPTSRNRHQYMNNHNPNRVNPALYPPGDPNSSQQAQSRFCRPTT